MPEQTLPKDIRRILIIKWSAMGDLVLASAIFEDVRKAFPAAEIHLNTLPVWAGLFRTDPRFSRIISIDTRKKGAKFKNAWRWLQTVKQGHYDLVIDLQTTDRSALLLKLLRLIGGLPRYRVGNIRRSPYNYYPGRLPDAISALDKYRAAIEAAGIAAVTPRPVMHVPDENERKIEKLLQHHHLQAGSYALLLPGCQAAGYLKRWGSDNYAGLARNMLEEGLDKVVLIGAADEMEDCREIAARVGAQAVNLCGETAILDIIPLAREARYIIANDTGTAHIASATETPMVVVCGPTDPHKVKPAGDNVIAVQADIECKNCYCKKGCDHHSCMKLITPGIVSDLLQQRTPQTGQELVIC
jgi:heptosyltransferase-2